ncbi:DUF5994 family protein [Lentzea flaviverrucosa]|uniref:Uncharacterized protein n=1 Tax=Lentzea flaviverrucosa TaxID=200379 RepID=A0A1H9GVR6_9PSEU|nr:DUF5994 family protein [Lentzea flaviverrucosa]RDI34786.1 hypothetical protein DFR72_101535 [Lentzea flaviverrucosa]SEQ54083.1 hypothetical protein SAMN05216195_102682 [Lentzea flaviverrucosa]
MTSAPHLSMTPQAVTATEQLRTPLRLRLRPNALSAGHVDGAWWPRSRDLAAELPALLAVLAVRLGDIPRVSYNLTEWDTAPRQIAVGGVRVRLGGFWSRPPHTVDVVAGDRRRLTLLLVPPDTDPSAAHRSMMRAAHRENTDTVEVLLRGAEVSESTVDVVAAGGTRIPEQTFRGVR